MHYLWRCNREYVARKQRNITITDWDTRYRLCWPWRSEGGVAQGLNKESWEVLCVWGRLHRDAKLLSQSHCLSVTIRKLWEEDVLRCCLHRLSGALFQRGTCSSALSGISTTTQNLFCINLGIYLHTNELY